MSENDVALWRSQSAVTDPGAQGSALDALPGDPEGLRQVSRELVAHYMGHTEGMSGPVTGVRRAEVDTRYAEDMFARLREIGPKDLRAPRPLEARTVGCCRDFAVLYVAMARHRGIPARIRVGYASYFAPGWYLDHVIAEVWDGAKSRWRLVEPEISDGLAHRHGFDPLDVPEDRFVTGARAWLAARAGRLDPERFVVAPDFDEPYTRGWLSLRHHVVQDLAALNKAEMLLWDQWGILDEEDPMRRAGLLDRLARDVANPYCAPEVLAGWWSEEGVGAPPIATSYSPAKGGAADAGERPKDAGRKTVAERSLNTRQCWPLQ